MTVMKSKQYNLKRPPKFRKYENSQAFAQNEYFASKQVELTKFDYISDISKYV